MPLLDLLSVLDHRRAPEQAVAWRGDALVTRASFHGRIASWSRLLNEKSENAFALYHSDALEFAATLFGAWQAGKTIFLPGDNLPGTSADLRTRVGGFLGEFAAEWRPLTAPPANRSIGCGGFRRIDRASTELVIYTSGSTGAAQPIRKKFFQLANEVANLEKQFGALLEDAPIVCTFSHQHIYGLLFNVLWPLAAGRPIQASPLSWFENFQVALMDRPVVLVSSPAHLRRLPENPAWEKAGSGIRAVFSSGAPLSFETAQECKRLIGQTPVEVYGSSETGGIAWRQQESAENQTWTALPGVRWRLAAHDAESDVIEVSSEHLPSRDWFRTADRGRSDSQGRFVLGGRVDQIVKVEGKRVSLSAIEKLLKKSPLVQSSRAVTIHGARQRIAAFVVLSASGKIELERKGRRAFTGALRGLLSDSVEPVGIPRIWRFLDALPVNDQDKTSQADLLALLDRPQPRCTEPRARLIRRDSERALFELVAPRELMYFDGHFLGHPILPGVVQVDWVISYGRRCFQLPAVFRGARKLKFQRVILPDTPVKLELVYRHDKSTLEFNLSTALGPHASGELLFGAAHV